MTYKCYFMLKAPKMPPSPTLLSNQNRKKPKVAFNGLCWKKFNSIFLNSGWDLLMTIFCKLKFSSIFEYCPNKNKISDNALTCLLRRRKKVVLNFYKKK